MPTNSRENKFRKKRAIRRLDDWRKSKQPEQAIMVPVEIVDVKGTIPKR